jgi:hypothetical protein
MGWLIPLRKVELEKSGCCSACRIALPDVFDRSPVDESTSWCRGPVPPDGSSVFDGAADAEPLKVITPAVGDTTSTNTSVRTAAVFPEKSIDM